VKLLEATEGEEEWRRERIMRETEWRQETERMKDAGKNGR